MRIRRDAARDYCSRTWSRSVSTMRYLGRGMSPSKSDRLLAEAMAHHHAGRLDDAERGYRQLLARDAASRRCAAPARRRRAPARQRGGGARSDQPARLRCGATDPRYHNNLGEVLRAMNRPGEAAAAYERAIALKPDYAEALEQPRPGAARTRADG